MSVFRALLSEKRVFLSAKRPPGDALLELGEIEAGVLDANPDDENLARAFGRAMRAAALGRWEVEELAALVPKTVVTSVPEGFAFYGLDPDMYARAARRFHAECHPQDVVVTGIRSIGTTLSAVVAVALEDAGARVERITVRPEGHPFDRRVRLNRRARGGEWIAIVDEGPGLSGSSFCGTARAWIEAGAKEDRIVFFPSWDPDPARLYSEEARRMWGRHRRYVSEYVPPFDGTDISAGKWREKWLPEDRWPAVNPQFERRKYLLDGGMAKFHGFGSYGAPAMELSEALKGFVPAVKKGPGGYLIHDVVGGRIAPECDRGFLDHVLRYLRYRGSLGTGDGVSFDELIGMIRMNVPDAPDLERFRALIEDQPKVPVDGRMLPHEWIRTSDGYLKTDAVDHCRDHFFPGYQDIAWDLAGFSEEYGVDAECLCEKYGGAHIRERVAFYRIAYLAFRLGCAELGRQGPDRKRFDHLATRYRGRTNPPSGIG
jgi:hypothetical protein